MDSVALTCIWLLLAVAQAAGTLPYGAIIDVMDAVKGAGVQRMGGITEGMRKANR